MYIIYSLTNKQEKVMVIKQSKAIKNNGAWRILRHDGEVVGAYATKQLAEAAIAKMPWLL